MADYLMRVEAVNFDSFVTDTHDLSTIRGGGLLLLDAPALLDSDNRLKRIYSGASTAVYRFHAESDAQADKIRRDVEDRLHEGPRSGATILVVFEELPGADDFPKAMRSLQNKIRWRQLQSPSVVYPPLTPAPTRIDELDDIRPALERPEMLRPPRPRTTAGRGAPMVLSETTFERREHGREEKRRFYASRGEWGGAHWAGEFPFHTGEYVNDFDELSSHPDKGRTKDKIAVIYLDGNRFGQIAKSCRNPEEIRKWSETVQANQNSFLHWLLSIRANGAQTSWHWSGPVWTNRGQLVQKERAFRIETLLWGGDEIIWVVPAWCGWWVLGNFFNLCGRLPWKNSGVAPVFTTDKRYRLTHGASVVFSHAKAPIQRVIRLAKHLAERPKQLGTERLQTTDYRNYFTYQVLESFDHLGSDPDEVRKLRMPRGLQGSMDSLILPGDQMTDVVDRMEKMRTDFPRTKLHWLLDFYCNQQGSQPDANAEKELETAKTSDAFNALKEYFGSTTNDGTLKAAATWTHIAELWDYTPLPDWKWPTINEEAAE